MFTKKNDKDNALDSNLKYLIDKEGKLKEKLDAIPETNDVIVDFSLCEFVDHTVMENLNNYQELFSKRGGHFEVVGLDLHDSDSKHPFALKRSR